MQKPQRRFTEPRWHAAIAVVLALALYVTLPPKIVVGPLWLLPLLVLVILVPLMILAPRRVEEAGWQRAASIVQIAILNAFNVATLAALFAQQLSTHRRHNITGEDLLLGAVQIWLTNVIVYGLWYWEIDGGGPRMRDRTEFPDAPRDFLFPQMALAPDIREKLAWRPHFLGYVFLAFNTATAFSPTDTFPLTGFAKSLMMAESLTSLVTIAIIAGRALNLLG